MDFLEDTFGTTGAPVKIEDLVQAPAPTALPIGAIRNRAATTAMLTSSPEKAVENYQLLMKEGAEGQNAVYDNLKESLLKSSGKVDMQGIMETLGDSKISLEEKRRVVSGIQGSQFLKDTGVVLHTNSLAKASEGEDNYQESARISSSDTLREIHDARMVRQGLVNAHAASLESVGVGTLMDMISLDVLPGGTAANALSVQQAVKASTGDKMTTWDVVKALSFPGHSKQEAYERLRNILPGKREEITAAFLSEIQKHNGTVFGADSQFAQARIAQEAFGAGGYSDKDKWMDTISSLADVLGLGWAFRGAKAEKLVTGKGAQTEKVFPAEWELVDDRKATKPLKALPNPQLKIGVEDEIKRIERNAVVRKENPASPASVVQQANPEQARNMHAAVVKSQTDEVAEALYGTSKDQAIINDIYPQAATESGAVTSKVVDIERTIRKDVQVDPSITEMIHDTGAIYYSNLEKAYAKANVVNNFSNVEGLAIHNAEGSFSVVGGRIKIDAMYGTSEGGFLTAHDAVEQAKFALSHTGIRDDDIIVMVKQGLDYVPTTLAEQAGKEGSYKIRISTFHDIDPTDITREVDGKTISAWDPTTVKRNWTDSLLSTVSQNKGSLSSWMVDAASMVDPRYTGAAVVATDKVSGFEKLMFSIASEFSDKFVKLDKKAKARVDDYIREANYNRIPYDEVSLKLSRGFSDAEIATVRSWKNFWDQVYYLENYDAVRTLNAGNYQVFKNNTIEFFAKPIAKNQNIGWFYDPSVDSIVRWGQGEGDVLYAAGGTYVELRRPILVNGEEVSHAIVRNTPTEYSRKVRDTDVVVPYIDGYSPVRYQKNAKFVDEVLERDAKGNPTKVKTIAVAKDTAEAMHFLKRTAGNAGKSVLDYRVRGDVNGLRTGSDEWWDLNSSVGRIAQRHRGKMLEDASGNNHLGRGSYIVNPVDSAVNSARSISGRTVNRPMLEAAKARFINQHSAVIPSGNFGTKVWPSHVDQISAVGDITSKAVRDARSDYLYINYLENGYINSMDEFFKQGFNALATSVGDVIQKVPSGTTPIAKAASEVVTNALGGVERGLMRASEVPVTGTLKGAVFVSTIVSNIWRQWIMQPHQVLRTIAYNPEGWQSGAISQLVTGYLGQKMGVKNYQGIWEKVSDTRDVFGTKQVRYDIGDFIDYVERSNLFESVDKNNLVRGTLLTAASSGNAAMQQLAKYTVTPARVVGFDLGEMANLLGHAAAVYERRKRMGWDLKDLAQRDESYHEIRAITGDFNFAGDMPYNHTSAAILTQFIQPGHKMVLQISNRRIEPVVRYRMAAMDLVMWGSPFVAIGAMIGKDVLPDNPFHREAFVWGLESAALNHTLSKMAERDVNIDWSSLAPGGLDSISRMMHALFTGGPEKALIESPVGQKFLKGGGPVRNAISHVSRFMGMAPEIDETPETALQVTKEVMNAFSGASNYNKMMMILETGKLVDKAGKVVAGDLGTIEAIAQGFGMPPAAPRDYFAAIQELQKDPKKLKEAVLKDYALALQYYTTTTGKDNTSSVWQDKVVSSLLRSYKSNPAAVTIINQQFAKDMQDPTSQLSILFLKRIESGFPSTGGLNDTINKMPVPEEEKVKMRKIKKHFEDTFANDKEGSK